MESKSYSYKDMKKMEKELSKKMKDDRDIKLCEYSFSDDPTKRALAAKYGINLEYLMEDDDFDVLKYVARYSAKYSEEIARYFFHGEDSELRTMAALSLAENNLLSDKEIENMETPILRLLVKSRLSLMQIARIHKVGEIKELMNEELYRMSRIEHLDVTELRNELNSQPFLYGDYMYKMDFDIEDMEPDEEVNPFKEYIEKEEKGINENQNNNEDESNQGEKSLDELLGNV